MSEVAKRSRVKGDTPEAREAKLTALAYDYAEEQLRNKTASSQIVAHFLNKGSARDRLELEKLREENKLLRAKTEAIKDGKQTIQMLDEAMNALRSYSVRPEEPNAPI